MLRRMCTLVVLNGFSADLPVVLAANRDEFFGRPTEGPQALAPGVFGGRDLVAGGTWMGVTPGGFFAGLTNQRTWSWPDAARASRGQVVLEVLRRGDVASAEAWLREVAPGTHNPFNLIYGDAARLRAFYARDAGNAFADVPLGIHVLPNDALDSPTFPKVERARALLRDLPSDWPGLRTRLTAMLGDRRPPDTLPAEPEAPVEDAIRAAMHSLCVVTPNYGTRSASLVALARGQVLHYEHLEGRPGEAPWQDVTSLLSR
jgi:uncharacterized protein with NRDE domain